MESQKQPKKESMAVKAQKRFKTAMKKRGLEVRKYNGRFFYRGYAAETSDVSWVSRSRLNLQYDNLGLDYIVYPSRGISEEEFEALPEV